MLRLLSTLITIGTLGYGAWWLNDAQPQLKQVVLSRLNFGKFETFEATFTPKQIAAKKRLAVPKESESSVKLHPYLLMRVKFTSRAAETEEGVILWDLIKGEMVLNTKHWETTHGFADCIDAKARAHEYTIIHTIAESDGNADHESLVTALNLDSSLADIWVERCQQKKLIVKQEDGYRIHLHNPVLCFTPSTEIATPLITSTQTRYERLARHYSPIQIKKAAQAAFGSDFAIRSMQDVFLPVYSIKIENPDGSLRTTFWNGLTGQQIHDHLALIE
ncbi:MAG: hypothetical protein AAF443_05690 [Chlamydiota bacterium]